MAWRPRVATVLLALAALALGCAPDRPRHVLLVTLDTTRADHLGAYGYPLARTPAFDRLASEGVLALDATASAPVTMPSHASIHTGLYPPAHGVRDNGTFTLSSSANTLAERLGDAGWATAAFVSAIVLDSRYGLDQGFSVYDDNLAAEDAPKLFMIRDRPARRTAPRAVEWLRAQRSRAPDQPVFLWVHFFDAHHPWQAPTADRIASPTPYDAEIAAADSGLATLLATLDELGMASDTLVIVTADHGESLGEHGEKTHAIFVYDATIRVPLVLRAPGLLPAGQHYEAPLRHIDLFPTILAATGLPASPGVQGVDVLAALQGRASPPRLSQYAESLVPELGFGMAPLLSLRQDGWKWIRAPRPELYDLRADPGELHDLATTEPRRGSQLDGELEAVLDASAAVALAVETTAADAETVEALRALGYLGAPATRGAMAGLDPKDGLRYHEALEDARHAAQAGHWKETILLLEELLAALPTNVAGRNILALAYTRTGNLEAARDHYRRSVEDFPDQPRVLTALAGLELHRGDLQAAKALNERALVLAPATVEAMANLGLLAALEGDDATAQDWYERAVAVDAESSPVRRRFADLRFEQGRFAEALAMYREVVALASEDFDAWLQVGASARRVGDTEAAFAAYDRAAALRPDSWLPPFNAACLAARTGDLATAWRHLEAAAATGELPATLLQTDPDLEILRTDPRFPELATNSSA